MGAEEFAVAGPGDEAEHDQVVADPAGLGVEAAEGDVAPAGGTNEDEGGDAEAVEEEHQAGGQWQQQPGLRPAEFAAAPPEIGGDEDPGEADAFVAGALGGDDDGEVTGADAEIGGVGDDVAADEVEQERDDRERPLAEG